MIHSNQNRRRLIVCLTVVLLIAAGVLGRFRYNTVNREYPSPKKVIAAEGETLTMDDVIEVSAGNLRIISQEAFKTEYDIDDDTYNYFFVDADQEKIILADVTITNYSDLTSGILDEYIFTIKSDFWSNGLDFPVFGLINEEKSTPGYGETETFTLIYTAPINHFHKNEWEDFENRPFELQVIYYPYTYVWALQGDA